MDAKVELARNMVAILRTALDTAGFVDPAVSDGCTEVIGILYRINSAGEEDYIKLHWHITLWRDYIEKMVGAGCIDLSNHMLRAERAISDVYVTHLFQVVHYLGDD